jgi:hypothetical protein
MTKLFPTPTRAQKRVQLEEAITWLDKNPTEKQITAARIFKVNPGILGIEIARRTRRAPGSKKPHGGQNRILSEAQNRAIQEYCRSQYIGYSGTTKQIVFQAIGHLLLQEDPPREPPS